MKLPTALIGFVRGKLRWEKCGGDQVYMDKFANYWLWRATPRQFFLDEDRYAVTHLQKQAAAWWPGFLLMQHDAWWQLCFHGWFVIRQQLPHPDGDGTIPGSEIVLYWRFGWSRWDAGDCKYVMGWIRRILGIKIYTRFGTWYGPGLHWD